MTTLPDDVARLRSAATDFAATPLWAALKAYIDRDRAALVTEMENPDLPAERLKFAAGRLAQSKRDMMLVERFLASLDKAQESRQRREERAL